MIPSADRSDSNPPAEAARAKRRQRSALRDRRRALTGADRVQADQSICGRIRNCGAFRRARRIGIFFAFDGEPDLLGLLSTAIEQGKRLYAPVIDDDTMSFASVSDAKNLQRNDFGILEPLSAPVADPRMLDLVLTPLVGFDSGGTRLGVGRGYYDRCFRFLIGRRAWQRPKLLGVGYSFQEVDILARDRWDVPLWGVVTEHKLVTF